MPVVAVPHAPGNPGDGVDAAVDRQRRPRRPQRGTLVKVAGTLRCQAPIQLEEFSQRPCAYFKAEITREEVYYDRDSDGKERRNTRTITVHSNIRNAACAIADTSGMVGLDFEGATVEAVNVLDRLGNPNSGGGVMGVLSAIGSAGDRYVESILRVRIARSTCSARSVAGGMIGKHAKGSHNKIFVISHKSEGERTKDLGSTAKIAFGLALAAFSPEPSWRWSGPGSGVRDQARRQRPPQPTGGRVTRSPRRRRPADRAAR